MSFLFLRKKQPERTKVAPVVFRARQEEVVTSLRAAQALLHWGLEAYETLKLKSSERNVLLGEGFLRIVGRRAHDICNACNEMILQNPHCFDL